MSVVNPRTGACFPILSMDIFCDILDFFRPEYCPVERQTLASLARTCRAFSEPSLNCLWKVLPSFLPLIHCYAEPEDVENAIPPSSSQFAVVDRYAHRVRELTISGDIDMRFLQSMTTRTFLLPNLRDLLWNRRDHPIHTSVNHVRCLLNPQLTALRIHFDGEDGSDEALSSFLDDCSLLCPNLKTLELHFLPGGVSPANVQALSNAICRQKILEDVVNIPINGAALEHLSTLPTLKMLSVTLTEGLRRSFPLAEPIFSGVEILSLDASDVELVTSLLQPHGQTFHCFQLSTDKRWTSEALFTLLNALASRSPTKPLKRLVLTCGKFPELLPVNDMASQGSRYHLSHQILQPLKAFGWLRELTITWSEQFSLDDDELADLASSWPSLRDFHLYCGQYSLLPTKLPTLRGLLMLVSACTELRVIALPLDATRVPEIEEVGPFEDLEFLTMVESSIDHDVAIPVAELLFQYFPGLKMLDWRYCMESEVPYSRIMVLEAAWHRVDDHIRNLRGEESDWSSVESESDDDDEHAGGLWIAGVAE